MANTLIFHTFSKLFFAVLSLFLIVGTCVTAVHHNQYQNQQQQQPQTYQAYQNYQNQYPSVVATTSHVEDQSAAHSQIEDKDYAAGHSGGWNNSWYLLCMPIIFIPLILLLCTPLFYKPYDVPYHYADHHGPAIHHYHPSTGWKRSADASPSLETTGKVLKSISKKA